MCRTILVFPAEDYSKKLILMPAFENNFYKIVYRTNSGKDALSYLQNNNVDAVFTGTRLSDMNILDFLQKVNCEKQKKNVVLIDSCQDFSKALTYIRHGAFDYLVSPITDEQLTNVTKRLKESCFLSNLSSKSIISRSEYTLVTNHLMDGNDNFLLYMEQIFHKAEINRCLNLIDIQTSFQNLLNHLWNDVHDVYHYLPLYFEKADLDLLTRTSFYDSNELFHTIMKLCTDFFDLVTLFKPVTNSNLIQKVTDFAWNNVENEISLSQIADSLYVNKSYLSHLFRAETGRTFVDYFTEIRMLRSRQLLKNHYKVYECALALGYKDTEYFSKVFKNFYGYKPTEYISKSQIPYAGRNLLLGGECR